MGTSSASKLGSKLIFVMAYTRPPPRTEGDHVMLMVRLW